MTEESRVEAAVRAMNGALRKRYETIRACLAEARSSDARARWRAASEMRAVRDGEGRYGAQAIPRLARALGRDEATLYKYIAVAECWTEAAFDALLAKTTVHGVPLSFSHFVELAAIDSVARRSALFERALAEGLGVRELARLGRESVDPTPASGETSALRRSLSEIVAGTRRMHEHLLGWSPVLGRLEDADVDEPGLDELLETAIEAHKALRAEEGLALRRLEAALAKRKLRRGATRLSGGR
jgi:hypothetical protein